MRALILAALLSGASCSAATTASVNATVTTDLTKAQADLQKIVSTYAVIKGIAVVAEAAEPSLAPTISAILARTDPIIATAQALSADATTTVPAVQALAAQIQGQVTTLTLTAAPAIKAVPSAATAT